jgi:tape measure domain-containing protein
MTVSGGSPQLKLQVSLDLAYFRGQLPSLGASAAGYRLPIQIKFDRNTITNELRKLGNSLGNKTYNITVQDTNLDIVSKKVDALAVKLKKLAVNINIGLDVVGAGNAAPGTAMKAAAKKLADQFKGDIGAAAKAMETMRGAAPFGTGTRSIPGFKAAAQGMGLENAFKLFFQELKQVDPQRLAKVLDDGSTMMMRENAEIKQGLDAIQSKARKLASDLGAMGDAAKLTGRAIIEENGKTLRPQNYGLKIASLLRSIEKLDADLRKTSVETGVDLLGALNELSGVLRSASNSFVKIAGFNNTLDNTLRMFDAATRQASSATSAYADRIQRRAGGPAAATAGPPLLPGSRGGALVAQTAGFNPYKVVEAQVRAGFDIIEDYHKRQLNNFVNNYKRIIDQYHQDVLMAAMRQQVRSVRTRLVSPAEAAQNRPLLGAGTTPAGLLPPAGGATPRGAMRFNSVTTGAFLGQPQLMRAPSVPAPMAGGSGSGTPPIPPFSGGGAGGAGGFGRALGGISLPGSGAVREIGNEFAMATKQVLLFGTAYKGLAFITSFPAQVGQAVGALQSFNNTLKAISPTAEEVRASNQFILDTVGKYNIPLQSARNGFTKLYASMSPSGFSGDEIRELFTGISQAAATFGMSADKVDRVNYAFAQMASKGQVMSEELKGQLGDVLPGSMAIFAEAAGFKGPDAIQKFSKALEDGAYKGQAMKVLLTNVGTVMRKEFGPGAEGAARTFQGVINRMRNSLTLLYEAFEPAAVGFLNTVVLPLTSGLKIAADGFSAFFRKTRAETAGGFAISKELEKMRPAFDGLRANFAALLPAVQSFGNALLSVSKVFLQIAGSPFVGYLARVYLSVLPLTMAIQALNLRALIPLVASFVRAIPAFIAYTAATTQGVTANKSLQLAMQMTGATAGATATQIRLVGTAIKVAFASTVVLAVVAGIGMIIEKLITLNGEMKETRDKALGAAQAIRGMSGTDARASAQQATRDVKALESLSQQREKVGFRGSEYVATNSEQKAALQRAGISTRTIALKGGGFGDGVELSSLRGAIEARQGIKREAEFRERQLRFEDKQAQSPAALQAIPEGSKKQEELQKQREKQLEAYEKLEEGMFNARKEREEQLAQIREDAIERFKRLEEDLADERKKIEREIEATRRSIAAIAEDTEFDLRAFETAARGGNPDLVRIEQEVAQAARRREEERIEREQRLMDEQARRAKAIEDLKASVAKSINEANMRYAKTISKAQLDYAKAIAKIGNEAVNYQSNRQVNAAEMTQLYAQRTMLNQALLDTGRMPLPAQGTTDNRAATVEDVIKEITAIDVRNAALAGSVINKSSGRGALNVPAPSFGSVNTKDLEESVAKASGALNEVTKEFEAAAKTEASKKFVQSIQGTILPRIANLAQIPGEKEAELERNVLARDFRLNHGYGREEAEFLVNAALEVENARAALTQLTNESLLEAKTPKEQDEIVALYDRLNAAITEIDNRAAGVAEKIFNPRLIDGLKDATLDAKDAFNELMKPLTMVQSVANGIAESFGNAFAGMIAGTTTAREALAGFFQNIANSFTEMVGQMITQWIRLQLLEGIGKFLNAAPVATPTIGPVAQSAGIVPKANFYGPAFANGGIAIGGFQAFATGGIVKGPTMGLVGEGRYNEAVVPLPDGKSIPVELGDGGSNQVVSNITVNITDGKMQSDGNGSNSSEFGKRLEGAVKQVITQEMRPGGVLAGKR